MLRILRLREEAQSALGDDFDLDGFHDAVLRRGALVALHARGRDTVR